MATSFKAIDELTLATYSCIRELNPKIHYKRWTAVFQNVPELEIKYKAKRAENDRRNSQGNRDANRDNVASQKPSDSTE